ncbi:MAG: ankyrin repeat domain-containing protein, partial [Cyanobacteria bacterium J06558_2]
STGDFALASAAGGGHVDVFNYLAPLTNSELRKEAEEVLPFGIHTKELEENADPLVKELSDLVFDKNLKEIKEIIKKGVDVNGFDEIGNRALCLAVAVGDLEIVRVLLEAGADPNLTPEPELDEDESNPPLWFANSAEITKLLIDAGADINFQFSNGDTILIVTAERWGASKKTKVLLENGADINIKNNEGKTALICAAQDKDNLEDVKLLIKFGADINIKDHDGNTALSLAKEAGNHKIIQLLEEADANDS